MKEEDDELKAIILNKVLISHFFEIFVFNFFIFSKKFITISATGAFVFFPLFQVKNLTSALILFDYFYLPKRKKHFCI